VQRFANIDTLAHWAAYRKPPMTSSSDTSLARTLCARLCHDLGGPIGSLAGALDLLPQAGEELLEVAQEGAGTLRQRLRLYAAAWGGPTEALEPAAMEALLAGAPVVPRVRFDLSGLEPAVALPAPLVPIALNAALLAAEALPRGGTVRLSGSALDGLMVLPVADLGAPAAAWPPFFLALMTGQPQPDPGPREVLGPLLRSLLDEAGWSASLALGPGQAAAPLLLVPD
jgi:histidine phosphotransferase ChpT